MECAAEGDGIRVNTVHPGVIDTPIWTKISGSAGRNVPIDPNEVAKAGVPLGRVVRIHGVLARRNGVTFPPSRLGFWRNALPTASAKVASVKGFMISGSPLPSNLSA